MKRTRIVVNRCDDCPMYEEAEEVRQAVCMHPSLMTPSPSSPRDLTPFCIWLDEFDPRKGRLPNCPMRDGEVLELCGPEYTP